MEPKFRITIEKWDGTRWINKTRISINEAFKDLIKDEILK